MGSRPARASDSVVAVARPHAQRAAVADDGSLAARIRAGDEHALEMLFSAYAPDLLAFAYSRLGEREVAEDVVHDVFVAVWRGRDRWELTGSLRAYLFTAVHHRVANARRAVGRSRRAEGTAVSGTTPTDWRARGAADDRLREEDLARAAARAIGALPERNREAYVLVRRHGLTHAEAARVLGVSVKTIEAHMARAVHALRVALVDWWS
jgi:RNA polymerase sigma-70 factor (ECF subfamily)